MDYHESAKTRKYNSGGMSIKVSDDLFEKGRVTVPHPKKDIPIATLKSIERQSGIKFI